MDPTSILERENLNSTSQEANAAEKPGSGWATAGAGLGDMFSGASTAPGNPAYAKGLQVGAQTMDALAQARQRINEQQQADQAASTLRNPQIQQTLGLKPEEAELAAVYASKGVPPEQITNMLQGFQKMRLGNALADPNGDAATRHGAAFALAPGTAAPKAEGPYGSTFDPLANGGSGSTTVGAQQAQIGNADIAEKQAQGAAATSNASSHQQSVANASGTGGAGKPPSGYRWQIDPDTMDLKLDNTGRPIAEPIPGLPAKGDSAVSQRYHEVVLNAANGTAREMENVKKLGYDTSTGAQQIGGTHNGIMNTLVNNLGKSLSSTEQQEYESTMTNVGRYLAQVENAGRMPPGTMTGSLDKLKNAPGTTENARLYNLALVRQNIESGGDTIQAGSANQGVKDAYDTALKRVQKAVPWTPEDVIDFQHGAKANQTFQQFLDAKGGASSAAPAAGGATDMGGGWSVKVH